MSAAAHTAAPLRIGMVAGEASGDMLAGLLLEGMRAKWPDLQAEGVGGPAMGAQGFEALWPHHRLAVRGYVEVLRHYRAIVGIRKQLAARWLAQPPQLFIGVDAPDFNLELEVQLKAAGVKTVHFVSPSIWAWRPERIELVRRAASHVLCIFPFEKAIYDRAGIPATYVGHPLAQVVPQTPDRAAARAALGLSEADTVLAILPGSRASEVQYLALNMFLAAKWMKSAAGSARAAVKFIVPCAPGLRPAIEKAAAEAGMSAHLMLLTGQSHAALAACDLTLIASGTATLEAALFKRPMVIAYNMAWLSWQIMRRKKMQPWVGLPNILLQDMAVPELLQNAATPEAMARECMALLNDPARCQHTVQRFEQLHHDLRRDTARLATDAIEQTLAE